jgi:hypothetical protein
MAPTTLCAAARTNRSKNTLKLSQSRAQIIRYHTGGLFAEKRMFAPATQPPDHVVPGCRARQDECGRKQERLAATPNRPVLRHRWIGSHDPPPRSARRVHELTVCLPLIVQGAPASPNLSGRAGLAYNAATVNRERLAPVSNSRFRLRRAGPKEVRSGQLADSLCGHRNCRRGGGLPGSRHRYW